jgi:hypothetical protein
MAWVVVEEAPGGFDQVIGALINRSSELIEYCGRLFVASVVRVIDTLPPTPFGLLFEFLLEVVFGPHCATSFRPLERPILAAAQTLNARQRILPAVRFHAGDMYMYTKAVLTVGAVALVVMGFGRAGLGKG